MPTWADGSADPRIRRQPTEPIPTAVIPGTVIPGTAVSETSASEARTHIIRRAPVEQLAPSAASAPRQSTDRQSTPPTVIAAAVAGILSGWATAAVATDLISGRWPESRVFCLAIGFLTVLFAATSVPGVVLLLMRRPLGRYLVAFCCAVALLTFGALFVADTELAWPVHLVPALPLAALVSALHPSTRRWMSARGMSARGISAQADSVSRLRAPGPK